MWDTDWRDIKLMDTAWKDVGLKALVRDQKELPDVLVTGLRSNVS